MPRKKLIAANWKMYKTPEQTSTFFQQFLPLVADHSRDEIVVCAPFIDLHTAVAAAADNARAQGQALQQQVRTQWLALYATFSVDQKTVVKTLIQQHMAQAETFRAQMQQHWQQGATGTTN